jgi:hypothetical protein
MKKLLLIARYDSLALLFNVHIHIHIHGDPTGAALALKMRPTTAAFQSTS